MVSPRKSLAAFALVLLVASSGVLVAQAVQDAAWLADARVGAPRHGDVAAYAVTSEPEDFGPGGGDAPQIVFRWDGAADARDAFGHVRGFDRLVMAEFGVVRNVSFVSGTTTPHVVETASRRVSHDGDGTPTSVREHVMHRVTYPWDEGGTRYAVHAWPTLLLARAGWQGLAVADLAGVPVSAVGASAGFLNGSFRDAGADVVNGVPVRWLEAAARDVEGTVSVAFADGLPYPMALRLVVTGYPGGRDAPEDWPDRIVTTFTLTGFERGDGPRLTDVQDAAEPAPTREHVDRLARTRFGLPADGGADVPVPIEAAWREAADAPRFRDWSREHPSYALRGVTWDARDGKWQFQLEAFNGDTLGLVVEPAEDCPDASAPAPCVTVTAHGGYGSHTRNGEDGEELRIREYAFPRQGVTLAGVLESFAAWAVTSHAASLVQFDAARTWSDGSREPAVIRVTGGYESHREELVLAFATGRVLQHSWSGNATSTREFTPPSVSAVNASWAPQSRARVLPVDVPEPVPSAASGLALGLLALAVFAERLPAAGAFAFTRLARGDALANPRRAAVLDAVRDAPGETAGAIASAVSRGRFGTLYHLRVLERTGHVMRVNDHSPPRYAPVEHAPPVVPHEDDARSVVPTEERVLDLVRAEPGVHASDIADRLGVHAESVHEVVWRLVDAGLVEKRPGLGQRVALVPADAPGDHQ